MYSVVKNTGEFMDYRKEIGRRIRKAREGRRWSLNELSIETNGVLSVSRISNYEQGLRLPGPQEARILARALGDSAAYLMCLDDIEGDMQPEEIALLRNWRALPERDRNDYARRIAALALAYRDAVPDEKLKAWDAKEKKEAQTR